MSVKHCVTFVHSSSTLHPHAITSGLFPIPCLTLVYRTSVTRSTTLLLSIFHSLSPLLTSNARLSPLTCAHAYKHAPKHHCTYTKRQMRAIASEVCRRTHSKLAAHSHKSTCGWWACGGFDVSRSLPFVITAALVIPPELWPLLSSQNIHSHIDSHNYWRSGVKANAKGGMKKGTDKVCASCLLTAPLGLVKFDLIAFLVN